MLRLTGRHSTIALFILIAALLALTGGCATRPFVYTNVDRSIDFGAYETFGFYPESGTDKHGYSSLVTQYFKDAVRREMEAFGYSYSDTTPQLLVNFSMSVEEKSETQSSGPSFGYYSYRRGLYGVWPMYEPHVNTVNYKQGTANIDVIDAAKEKLVWEAVIEGRLTRDKLENAEETVDAAVHEMFREYPLQRNP